MEVVTSWSPPPGSSPACGETRGFVLWKSLIPKFVGFGESRSHILPAKAYRGGSG